MTATSNRRAGDSAAATVRDRVQRGGARFWKHSNFPMLPPSAVATALSRLAKQGALQRVSKGVYYRSAPTAFGMSMPAASSVAAATLSAPVHPAGLSAANVLGLTTQNPRRPEYATAAAGRPRALQGATIHPGRPQQRLTLSPEEGALLEVLREGARSSDLSGADTASRLVGLVQDEPRFRRLLPAALAEPPRVRAMLGALGQEAGVPAPLLERLRRSLNPLSRFDFGHLASLQYAKRWQSK